jgi:hypothetical protein
MFAWQQRDMRQSRWVDLFPLRPQRVDNVGDFERIPVNWLRVLDTAELSQVNQRIRHQLHTVVALLNALKPQEEPLELVFPRKGPLDTHPQGMDGFVEEAFASALGRLAVARILFDVGDQARIENTLPIVRRIKAAIEVEIGASQVQTHLFSHLLQRVQALR